MLSLRSLIFARAGARRGLLLTLALAITCVVAATVLVVGSLTQAMRSMVSEALATTDDDLRTAQMRTPLADPAQIDIGNEFLAARFDNGVIVHEPTDPSASSAEWVFEIDPASLDPWRMQNLAGLFTSLADDARAVEGLTPRGISVNTDIAEVLRTAGADALAIGVVAPVPLLLIIITGGIALVQLSKLLGRSREREYATLHARGLSTIRGTTLDGAEMLLTTAFGALIGTALGALGVAALQTGEFLPAVLDAARATWFVPVAAVLVFSLLGALSAGRSGRDARTGENARIGTVAITAAVTTAVAGVFLWMLREPSPGLWQNVVIALAPALALAALALIALALSPLVSGLLARRAERRPDLSPALPMRSLARRAGSYGVIVVLVSLSTGGAVLAGASIHTWETSQTGSALHRVGADARAEFSSREPDFGDIAALTTADGIDNAGLALLQPARAGDTSLTLVALSPGALAASSAAGTAEDSFSPVGIELPEDARDVTLTFDVANEGEFVLDAGWDWNLAQVTGLLETMQGTMWLVDPQGTPLVTRLHIELDTDIQVDDQGAYTFEGTIQATATLPETNTRWRAGAFSLNIDPRYPFFTSPDVVTFRDLTVGNTPLDVSIHHSQGHDQPGFSFAWDVAEHSFLLGEPLNDLSGIVSVDLQQRLALETGGTFNPRFEGSGRQVRVHVSDVAAFIPGTNDPLTVLLPLDALLLTLYVDSSPAPPNQLWASGPGAIAALSDALPSARIVTADVQAGPVPALTQVWWVAVLAAALLAAIAVVATALAIARRRGVEVFVLRALGVPLPPQRWRRAMELLAVCFGAVFAGGALGWAVAVTTVPVLTLTAVPQVLAAFARQVGLTLWPLVAVLALIALAVWLSLRATARAMNAQFHTGRVLEEL